MTKIIIYERQLLTEMLKMKQERAKREGEENEADTLFSLSARGHFCALWHNVNKYDMVFDN